MKLFTAIILATVALSALSAENCSTAKKQEEVLETTVISTDVPSHLKGAKIIVRQADGRESEVPAELFKVVPRKQQRIITKVANTEVVSCKESVYSKNRVSVLGGYGLKPGMDKSINTDSSKFKTRHGAIGGLQYQRSLNEDISVGAQGMSNGSGALMIGLDF